MVLNWKHQKTGTDTRGKQKMNENTFPIGVKTEIHMGKKPGINNNWTRGNDWSDKKDGQK